MKCGSMQTRKVQAKSFSKAQIRQLLRMTNLGYSSNETPSSSDMQEIPHDKLITCWL